jgi:serine protease Do
MNRFMLSLSFPILACLWLIPDEGVCQSGSRADNPLTLENLSASLADLAQRVRPSVVQIRTVGYGTAEGQDVGLVSSQQGTGSGVILDREGFIVTNAHIVKNARHIEVWLNATNMQQGAGTAEPPKQRSVSASLVGIDLDMDLAVIKIDRSGLEQLLFADSDSLRQGQIVLAVGNPMALENSVTNGCVARFPKDFCCRHRPGTG